MRLILPGTSTFYSHSSNQQGQGRASLLVPSLPRQTALRTAAGTVQGQSKQLGCRAGDTERGHGPTTLLQAPDPGAEAARPPGEGGGPARSTPGSSSGAPTMPRCGRFPPGQGAHAAPPMPARQQNAELPGDGTQKGKRAPALEDLAVGPQSVRESTTCRAHLAALQCGRAVTRSGCGGGTALGTLDTKACGGQPCRARGSLPHFPHASSQISCSTGTKHRLACGMCAPDTLQPASRGVHGPHTQNLLSSRCQPAGRSHFSSPEKSQLHLEDAQP